nr:hypothetical protein Iba_scaffold43264CG0010 [Ipomoea batatas]GMD83630.1 hypothetical protein Iba_chr14aCG6970 [Ipomoea batatas]
MSCIESLLRWGNFGNGTQLEALLNQTPTDDVSFPQEEIGLPSKPHPKRAIGFSMEENTRIGQHRASGESIRQKNGGNPVDPNPVPSPRQSFVQDPVRRELER